MCILKNILPDKGVCRIKFILKDTIIDHPKEAAILGDFNNWDVAKGKMHRTARGYFEKELLLPIGRVYECRYLIDNVHWENDWQADGLIPSPVSDEDNMVICSIAPLTQTKRNRCPKIKKLRTSFDNAYA
jgi:hypothetical protein